MASEEIPGDGVDTKIEELTNVKNGRPPPADESDRNIPPAKRQATMEDEQESPVPPAFIKAEEIMTTDSPEAGSDSNTVEIQVGQLAMRTPEVVSEPSVAQEQEEGEVRSSATLQSTGSDTDEVMEIGTTDSEELCILESLIERHNAGDKSFDLAQAIIDQACRDARDEDENRACATIELITVWLNNAFPDVNTASDSNSVPLEIWGILALFIETVLDNRLHSYRLRTEDRVVAHHKLLDQATIWCIHALRNELQEPGRSYDRFSISALGRMVREPWSPKLLSRVTPPLHAFILMDGFTLLADYAAIQFVPTAPAAFEDLLLSLASLADICICSDKRSSWLIEQEGQEAAESEVMLKNIDRSKPAITSLSKTAIAFLRYAIGSSKPPKKADTDKVLEQLRKVWAYWCDHNASLCWTYAADDSPRDIRSHELDLILFMLKSSVSDTRLAGIDTLSDTVVRILEKGRQWHGYSGPNIWDQWFLRWIRTEDVVEIILGQAPGSTGSLSMIRRSTRKNITLWMYFVIHKMVDERLLRAVLRAACSARDEALKAELWDIWKTLAGSDLRAARIMLHLLTELPIVSFQKVHLVNMVWSPMNRFFEYAQKEREHADIVVMQTQYALLRKAATAAEDTTAGLVEVTNGIDLYDFVNRTLESSTRTYCLPVKEDLRTVVVQAVESVRSEAPCVLADALFIYDFGVASFAELLPEARELERIYVDDMLRWIDLQQNLSCRNDARSVHVDRLLHTRLYRWGQMGRLSSWVYMQDVEKFDRVWEVLAVNPPSVTAREETFAIFKTWATMKEEYGLPLTILTRMMNRIEPSSLTMSSVGLVYAASFKSSIETPGFAPAKLFELLWPFLLGCLKSEVFEQMKKWTVNAVLALHKGQHAAEVEDRDAFHAHVMEVCVKELQAIASPVAENPSVPDEHLARFRRVLLFMYAFMDGYNEKISRFRIQRQVEAFESEELPIGRNVMHVTLKIIHNNQPMRDESATFDLRETLSKVHQKVARIAQWADVDLQIWRNQALVVIPPSDDLILDCVPLQDNQIYVLQKPARALKDQRVLASTDITPLRVFYDMWAQVKAFLSSPSGFGEAVWELLQNLPVYMPHARATLHEGYTGFSLSLPASVFDFLSDIRQLKIILDEDPGALTGDMAMNLSQRLMNACMELLLDTSSSAEYACGVAIELLYTLAELLRTQVDEVQRVDGSAVHASEQSFVIKLFNVMQVNHDDSSSIDLWVLLARAMEVMLLLLRKNSTLWDFICGGHMADFAAMLKTCLLTSTSIHARHISCAAVQSFYDFVVGNALFSESSEHPAAVLEREVMAFVLVAEEYSTNAEFFRLGEHILKLWSAKWEDVSRMQMLFKEWVELLLSHESIESADSSRQDSFVEGVSTLLNCLIKSQQETNSRLVCSGDNLRVLFQLLFLPNVPQHAADLKAFKSRCYHERTRAALYELISNLTETPEKVRMFLERITDVLNSAEESGALPPLLSREWLAKAPSGFCGMKNLSNTCYVNSVVTQLYMNPSFRQFVFHLPIEHQTEEPTADEASPMDLLIKLQRLFADLQTSKQKFIDPTPFIRTIKDYDGKPLDPTVQFDADEFFNMLFDRIEGCLPGAEKERLRKQYGGTLVQQVIAKECGHLSEREEAFNAIQCDIKGKSTLIDSLRAYVEGETMDSDNQYRCDQCQSYVDALKRTCIKNLPNHLIFHLKRFDFDFQTMLRTKLNDHFEFPMKLSMREFTYDYLRSKGTDNNANSTAPSVSKSTECDSLDEYELAGVLVHGGSAESGHYFSYARIRDENTDSHFRWFEFNDTEVTPFDPADIMHMCYGGSDEINGSRQRSFNAYMLFYERVQQKAEENVVAPVMQKTPQPPNHVQEEIALENAKAETSLFLADTQLLDFLACLSQRALSFASDDQQTPSKSAEIAEALRSTALSAILTSVCVIAPRMQKFDMHGKRLLNVLLEAGKNNVDVACHLLRYFLNMPALLKKLILQVQDEDCRMTVSHVLLKAIKNVRQNEPALYGLRMPRLNSCTDDEDVISQPYLSKGIMRQFLEAVYEAMDGLGRLAHNWDALFQLLAGIAELGYAEAKAIAEMSILKGSLEFFALGNITANSRNTGVFGNLRLGNRKKWPNFTYLTEFIKNVLVRCNISSINRDGDERTDNSGDIDEDVAKLLMSYGFWEQVVWSDNSKTALDLSRYIFAKGLWEIRKYACKELIDVFNGNYHQAADIAPFLADVVIAKHRDCATLFNKVLRALDKEVSFDKGVQWLAFFDRLLHCNLPTISTMVHDRMPDWIPSLLLSRSRPCRLTAAKIWLDCFTNEEQQTELLDRAERMLRASDELIGSKWESCLQNRVRQRKETLGEFLEVYEKTAEFLEDESAMRTVANYRRVIERTLLDSDSDDLDAPQAYSEDQEYELEDPDFDQQMED